MTVAAENGHKQARMPSTDNHVPNESNVLEDGNALANDSWLKRQAWADDLSGRLPNELERIDDGGRNIARMESLDQNLSSLVEIAPEVNERLQDNNSLVIEIKRKSNEILTNDGKDFMSKLRELEAALVSLDPPTDTLTGVIDARVNKGVEMDLGSFFLAAYSSTHDFQTALKTHLLVNRLMRYIALADDFYETGDPESLSRANPILEEIATHSNQQLKYSLQLAIERIWPYWRYERMMRNRLLTGSSFSDKELRYYILFKSSDTPMLYCTVLENLLENFNPNVAMVFHYNQALIDIHDDYFDIEEDLRSRMPNVFLLAASELLAVSHPVDNFVDARTIFQSGRSRILKIVDWFSKRLAEISIPDEYAFLNHITNDHLAKLKSALD